MISGCIMCTLLAYPKNNQKLDTECMGSACACETSGVCTCGV